MANTQGRRRKRPSPWGLAAVLIAMLAAPAAVTGQAAGPVPLKVALLPIVDAFPFYVAEARGYFTSDRFSVTALPVGSGLERDQLLQAGEADGALNEMTTVAGFNRDGVQVTVVGVARHPYDGHPLFRLVTAPDSGILTPADLAGVPIAVSTNTIIEYVTDRILVQQGLDPGVIVKRSVPVIPERYQLLMLGRLQAAVLPDPLAASAIAAGAVQVFDDTAHPELSVSVLTFTAAATAHKAPAIRFFLAGWDRAVRGHQRKPRSLPPAAAGKDPRPPERPRHLRHPPFSQGRSPGRRPVVGRHGLDAGKGAAGRTGPLRRIGHPGVSPVIAVRDLTFAYGGQTPTFDRFDFAAGRGEIWSVIGPSGCGKTTLLYLLAGLLFPAGRHSGRGRPPPGAAAPPNRARPPGPRPAALGHRAGKRASGARHPAVLRGRRPARPGRCRPGPRRRGPARVPVARPSGHRPPVPIVSLPAVAGAAAADGHRPDPGSGPGPAPARRAVLGAGRPHPGRPADGWWWTSTGSRT